MPLSGVKGYEKELQSASKSLYLLPLPHHTLTLDNTVSFPSNTWVPPPACEPPRQDCSRGSSPGATAPACALCGLQLPSGRAYLPVSGWAPPRAAGSTTFPTSWGKLFGVWACSLPPLSRTLVSAGLFLSHCSSSLPPAAVQLWAAMNLFQSHWELTLSNMGGTPPLLSSQRGTLWSLPIHSLAM